MSNIIAVCVIVVVMCILHVRARNHRIDCANAILREIRANKG